MHDYTKPREYYEKKKEEFLNTKSFYDTKPRREQYGNTLAPPYTKEEVEEYEKDCGVRIPSDLRKYLINISRETIGSYPDIITLHEPIIEYFYKDEDSTYPNFKPEVEKQIYDDEGYCLPFEKMVELGYHRVKLLFTHQNGCTDDDFICIKGKFYGDEFRYGPNGDINRLSY